MPLSSFGLLTDFYFLILFYFVVFLIVFEFVVLIRLDIFVETARIFDNIRGIVSQKWESCVVVANFCEFHDVLQWEQ